MPEQTPNHPDPQSVSEPQPQDSAHSYAHEVEGIEYPRNSMDESAERLRDQFARAHDGPSAQKQDEQTKGKAEANLNMYAVPKQVNSANTLHYKSPNKQEEALSKDERREAFMKQRNPAPQQGPEMT